MPKKILCFLLCFAAVLSLSGCDFFTPDTAELLSPPTLTGDMLPINEAIEKSEGSKFTFRYPSRGNYRSAVVQHDVDKDGILEAFAFYSTTTKEETQMNINVISNKNGEWNSVAKQSITAGGVDRIDFCDLDGDRIDEILVGWEIYGTSELKLAVYSLGDNTLTQRMLEQYNHYVTCDLDKNDLNEVFIIRSAPSEGRNSAHLFSLTNVGVTQISSCQLDPTAKTLNHPIVSTLSNGENAVYIDEIKGVGATTEVVFLEKGQLVNPLLDSEAMETTATLRIATMECRDINDDDILEIPVRREVPNVTRTNDSEKQYLTDWCSFNGTVLTSQMTTFVSVSEGYYYIIPTKWIGQIALLRDESSGLTEIYRFNSEENVSAERLLYIRSVKKSDWDSGVYKNQDVTEIVNNGETSYICYICAAAVADGITAEKVKNDLKLY